MQREREAIEGGVHALDLLEYLRALIVFKYSAWMQGNRA
jgi:hypothetical protein